MVTYPPQAEFVAYYKLLVESWGAGTSDEKPLLGSLSERVEFGEGGVAGSSRNKLEIPAEHLYSQRTSTIEKKKVAILKDS